jgi:hypothetical protein
MAEHGTLIGIVTAYLIKFRISRHYDLRWAGWAYGFSWIERRPRDGVDDDWD